METLTLIFERSILIILVILMMLWFVFSIIHFWEKFKQRKQKSKNISIIKYCNNVAIIGSRKICPYLKVLQPDLVGNIENYICKKDNKICGGK